MSAATLYTSVPIAEVESRTQGSRPRPRTQKKSEAKAKDSLSEDRHSRGQGQECSRPRTMDTSASALQKKRSSKKFFRRSAKKNVFTKIFQAISSKRRFPKHFSSAPQNLNNSKNSAVLEPRAGQFSRTWGLEAKDFKMCPRGPHLWPIETAPLAPLRWITNPTKISTKWIEHLCSLQCRIFNLTGETDISMFLEDVRWTRCGVKELIMFSACKCCNHADHASDDLSAWTKLRTLQLVFVSCFCDVSALLRICLVWVFPKRMVFYLFLSVGARAQVSFFFPNFDVIRTKEVEMEPVFCIYNLFRTWRKYRVLEFLKFLKFLHFVHFLLNLRSFSSLSFYSWSCYHYE